MLIGIKLNGGYSEYSIINTDSIVNVLFDRNDDSTFNISIHLAKNSTENTIILSNIAKNDADAIYDLLTESAITVGRCLEKADEVKHND